VSRGSEISPPPVTSLIPREMLLANPERSLPSISPDGRRLAYLAPNRGDALQVWLRTIGKNNDRCVSSERRSIQIYQWAGDSETILYNLDADGDENHHICAIDLKTGDTCDLTPWQGVRCQHTMTSAKRPHEILAVLNVRDRKMMDVWRIDLRTGAATLEVENPGDVSWWVADDDLVVRGTRGYTPGGGFEIRVRADSIGPWRTLLKTSPDEWVFPVCFDASGRWIVLLSSVGSDSIRLLAVDIESRQEREIASMPGFDVEQMMIHPTTRVIEAVAFEPGRREWRIIDPSLKADFDPISRLDDGDFRVMSRDLDNSRWIVEFQGPHRPARYFLWDRTTRQADFLFSDHPEFENFRLASMEPIQYRARDGMELHGYLATPPGIDPRNLPLALGVHGGPWLRNYWRFNVWAQLLANRGYAVLMPNFRGSLGYGAKYLHAGDRQWGRAMQDDLTDAVEWAIARGIADPERVAIFGHSYGGYAAVAGAAFTPDLYRCAVDLSGQCNLATLIKSFPEHIGARAMWNARVGNPDDPADAELLRSASPLFAAERIKIPLLIGLGANDVRVKQSEAEEIVAAIEKAGGSVVYVLYPDEGHVLSRRANRTDFIARAEKFLAEHLGGRYEPMEGEKLPGSSAVVKVVGN
jgi:dipeptidyl aminopeptidase/acylaminoacyl peptidase